VGIKRFDKNGHFFQSIGRAGEGPGEFSFPTAMTVDDNDNIYVADRLHISIFNADGDFIESFRHEMSGGYPRSLRVRSKVGIFLSCFDVYSQQVIHKYNFDKENEISFAYSYGYGQDVDVRVETAYAGGVIDINNTDIVYYSQMTPYEIRKFTSDGDLLSVIRRTNDFVNPPRTELRDDGGINLFTATISASLVILNDNKFINIVKTAPQEKEAVKSIVDLFSADGTLLISKTYNKNWSFRCRDNEGRIYGLEAGDYPRIVQCTVKY
jgi:hypothetical protein